MRKSFLVSILAIQLIGLFILAATMQFNDPALYASAPQLQIETPQPFLGSIYYGQEDVWQVFDHQFPGASDNNNYVVHYDGTVHTPITLTPLAGTTPTPGPTAAYIPGGYGYTRHLGIDYSLEYEPVLAAASGEVTVAGWSDTANHRLGYGLHVRMTYVANEIYEVWYGHLSALVVETGQTITIDPENPGDRKRILGISGNTGHVFGIGGLGCGPITEEPETSTCGQHLHLEVRTIADVVVNPYGWIGTTTPDPWAVHPSGEISYNLWATRPALVSGADQYPGAGDVGLPEPEVDEISLLIDDRSVDFTLEGSCFEPTTGAQSYNNSYHYTSPNGNGSCWAQWLIEPDAFAPPGEYDIYVHIPDDENASLDSIYTIEHNEQTDQAHVVQLAYPNGEHSAWAYIGRYDFALDDSTTEYVRLKDNVADFDDSANSGRVVLADAIKLVPAQTYQLPAETLYFSWANDVIINGSTYREEDIVAYDPLDGSWSFYFDGSDVGLEDVDVDAFTLLANGDILFSIDETIEGLGAIEKAEDTDIIRFIPTSTGANTEGDFELYLTGSDFGLDDPVSGPDRDIDAIGFIPGGELLISTTNDVAEWGVGYFSDEDLIYWDPTGLVPVWVTYFDGSDVGLTDSGEDVNGTWLDPDTGDIYLTTIASFSVTSLQGNREDLFICIPESIGATTSCDFIQPLYWNGSAHGAVPADSQASNFIVDGFAIVTPDCEAEINGSFERRFACWTTDSEVPGEIDWLVSFNSHTGLYSAEGLIVTVNTPTMSASLTSNPVAVAPTEEYCVSLYAKDIGSAIDDTRFVLSVYWYDNQGTPISSAELVDLTASEVTTHWQLFANSAIAPNGADTATLVLWLSASTFTDDQFYPYSLLVDDIIWKRC